MPSVLPWFFAHISILSLPSLAISYFQRSVTAGRIPTFITRFPYCMSWFWLLRAALLKLGFYTQSTWHSSCQPRWHCCQSHSSHTLRIGSRNLSTITASEFHWIHSACIQKQHFCICGALDSQNNYLLRFCDQFKHLHPWLRISFQQLHLKRSFQIQLLEV